MSLKNAWEFYRAYQSVSRHAMSKTNGWKYDLFKDGYWDKLSSDRFCENVALVQQWEYISDEFLEIFPDSNRMDIISAMSMTFFNNNNKFYIHNQCTSDIIDAYNKYNDLMFHANSTFQEDMDLISTLCIDKGIQLNKFLSFKKKDDIPEIIYLFYREQISLTTLYILNNLYQVTNTNSLTLMKYLQNVDQHDIFISLFAKSIDMWELMFRFDYPVLGKIYIECNNGINNAI